MYTFTHVADDFSSAVYISVCKRLEHNYTGWIGEPFDGFTELLLS